MGSFGQHQAWAGQPLLSDGMTSGRDGQKKDLRGSLLHVNRVPVGACISSSDLA